MQVDGSRLTAGVAGAGTMGTGIAITIARAGIPVTLFDVGADALARARRQILEFFDSSVARGKLAQEDADRAAAALRFEADLDALSSSDVIVEAIFEHLPTKHELLSSLDRVCSPDTLFMTNASTLSIAEIAAGSGRPDRVVGAHYCLPAQLMKLVEMSRGLLTSDESWQRAWQFQLATGQKPIETRDHPGFILNHFCIPYHNDAIRMIDAGVAEAASIDRAMKAAMGFAMGPLELIDLIGLDTQLRASEALFSVTNDPRAAPPPLLRRMAAAGLLGRKSGRGFYVYGSDAVYGA
jgi:3-hydroxybutyryl-CoA dehydrogenase